MVYKLLLFVSQLQGTVLYVYCSMLSSYLYTLVVADWLKQWVAKIHSNILWFYSTKFLNLCGDKWVGENCTSIFLAGVILVLMICLPLKWRKFLLSLWEIGVWPTPLKNIGSALGLEETLSLSRSFPCVPKFTDVTQSIRFVRWRNRKEPMKKHGSTPLRSVPYKDNRELKQAAFLSHRQKMKWTFCIGGPYSLPDFQTNGFYKWKDP